MGGRRVARCRDRTEQSALIVDDYDDAIRFFVDVLGFKVAEDSPSLTSEGQPKGWVVVRPPGASTGLLLARADDERQAQGVGDRFPGALACSCASTTSTLPTTGCAGRALSSSRSRAREPNGQVAVFVDVAGNRWDLLGPQPSR